jgi:hypothetical protein
MQQLWAGHQETPLIPLPPWELTHADKDKVQRRGRRSGVSRAHVGHMGQPVVHTATALSPVATAVLQHCTAPYPAPTVPFAILLLSAQVTYSQPSGCSGEVRTLGGWEPLLCFEGKNIGTQERSVPNPESCVQHCRLLIQGDGESRGDSELHGPLPSHVVPVCLGDPPALHSAHQQSPSCLLQAYFLTSFSSKTPFFCYHLDEGK